ncbi:uncharacterized protein [Diadema setosum]|uniref:uncharacterized protein n=1 Tax=Diadema setosum TaxID=31175 RepID=UPI003B3A2EF6
MPDPRKLRPAFCFQTHLLLSLLTLGLLAGTAVSEEAYCHVDELGYDTIKDRVMTDTSNRIYIIDDLELECYGRISRWIYYSTSNQQWKPGVWRWTSGNYWKLVGENTLAGTTGGYTIYDVNSADMIQFQPGDKLGFRHASPALNYDKGFDALSVRYASISDYGTAHDKGKVYTVSSTDTLAYSFKAVFDDSDFSFDCDEETHGPGVSVRSSNDGGNYMMIMTSLPFTCYGQVKGWTFWGTGASGGFRPGIYRPVEGSTTQYTLIGESEVAAGHRLDEEVTDLIADESRWLTFEPGDLIGWRWNSGGARIRWDSSGDSIINMKYAGHTDSAYEIAQTGDVFTVSSDLNRAYSLQAVLSPFGYKGCYPENIAQREMGVFPGHIALPEMTRISCISACAQLAYPYAGLQEGKLCFCSSSYGLYGSGNSTSCDYTCEGSQYFTCGGFLFNQVFTTPRVVKGYTFDEVGLQVTYEAVEFNSNVTRGTGVTFSFDYGDGFTNSGLESGIYSHAYSEPRTFLVTGQASDLWLNTESSSIVVTTKTNLTNVLVDCPPAVEYNVVFGCKFEVYQGTNMTAEVDFGDGRVVSFRIQDAETLKYGSMVDHNIDLNNQPTSRVFLKLNDYIERDGHLVAWEFNAISTGTIYLQVYRPRCDDTYTFCLRTFTCIKHWMDCQDHESIFAKTCGDTGRYSFSARDCIQNDDDTLAGRTVYTSLQLDYDFVSEYTYTITETGRNFVKLDPSDYVAVQEGDIIGWYNSNQGKLAYVEADNEVDGPEILPTTANYASRLSGSYIVYESSGASAHGYKHALRAHVVRPSKLHVYHNFSEETNRREVTLRVNNTLSDWVSDNQTVKVMHVIKNVTIVAAELAITRVQETISVEPHPGTEVTYHWRMGNGDEIVTHELSVNYTWPEDGVYNITVEAYNDISRVITETFIVLQHTIKDFEWKDSVPATTWPQYPITPKKFGDESYINFGMSEGTNVTYEVTIGDGIVPTFLMKHDEDFNVSAHMPGYRLEDRMAVSHDGLTGSVITIYESIGYYPVYINASNRVSWSTINSTAVVQIEITNFRLVEPPPLKFGETSLIGVLFDTGTNLTFEGEFAGNTLDLTNASLYYMDDTIGEGYILIPADKYDDRGFYDLSLTTLNLVSGPYTDVVSVQVEYAIKDLQMWVSELYIMPHDSISIAFDMKIGSDLTMVMDFDDGNSETFTKIEMRRVLGDQYLEWHSFDVAADYNVTINCTSAVSEELVWTLIKVQNPVENVEMTYHSPGVIPYQEVGTMLFEYEYTGDQSTPPTDANVAYVFTDKIRPVEDFPIAESNPVQQYMPLAKMGPYSVFINISNLVSFMVFEADIEMEKPILDLEIQCPRRHIRVGEQAELTAYISWGSRVSWEWDFKDGSIVSIDVGGKRTRNHKYREPGTYPVMVSATNLLGTETYSISSDPVEVQHPVKGFEWIGRRLNRLWVDDRFTSIPFHLFQTKDLPFPTSASYAIDWGDGNELSETSLTEDDADGNRHTDSMDHIFTVTHKYYEWGQYNVTINLWNLVSSKTLVFQIFVYETITQLMKEVNYNEFIIDSDYSLGNDTQDDQQGYGTLFNYFPLEYAIVVKATHASGTDLTYTWDFGDTAFVPPSTTEAPSTTFGTTLEPTTVQTTTEAPENCTFVVEEWVNSVVTRLTNRDAELLQCSGGSIVLTPPPIPSTAVPTTPPNDTPSPEVNCTGVANCTQPTTTTVPTTTAGPTPTPHYTSDVNCTAGIMKSQAYNCDNYTEWARNETWDFVSNFTMFMRVNDTIYLDSFIDLLGEWNCLNAEVLTWIGRLFVRENVSLDVDLCPDPKPSKAPTTAPTTTEAPSTIPPTAPPPYVVQTKEPYAIWWYAQRGVYTVTLNVSNPVHWVVVSKTIVIQRGIADLVLSDHGPRSRNTTIEFELDTGNVGTDACYFVDFRDVTSDINSIAFWGHRQTCESRYPLEFKDPFLRFEEVSNVYLESLFFSGQDPNITLYNVFQTVNRYRIQVVAHNMVSEQTVSIPTAVTKAPCYYPEVNVRDENGCNQFYPFCDDDGNREYFASKDVTVYGRVKINCTSVKYALYTWRAFSVDDNDGSLTEIYELGDSVMQGFTQRELAIKKFVLPYGLYSFQLNVSMYGERGVERLDSVKIRVVATPLVARIAGGSEIRIRWNDRIVIDGLSETFDPDVDPSDKSGLRFVWMCKRQHETYQVWNDDYTELIRAGTAKASYEHEANDYGGCFGRYGFDRGGYGSILNDTEGAFTIDTFYMHEKMNYEIKMIVFKGDRMVVATQELQVASGNPPKMAISCRTNCKTKLNPTSRFALESTDLDARKGQILYYRWEIYKLESNGTHEDFVLVPTSSWLQYAGTGDSNANIAIDAGPFEDQSTYRIRVFADRTPSFENYGLASYDFITNERPTVGNCSMVPPNGTALETEFNIECQDWTDPDMPLNYRFAQRLKESESWTWLYNGEKSYMDTPTVFPQGYEENDFLVFLLVRVTDYIGSFSDLELTVEVRPPSVSTSEQMEMMRNMTGDDGAMAGAIAAGDTSTAANIIAACAGMLNVASSTAASSPVTETYTIATTTFGADVTEMTPEEQAAAAAAAQEALQQQQQEEERQRQEMRDSMITAMSLAIPNTVGAMKQLSSAMVTATSSTGEVSVTAADDTMRTGSQFMGLLSEKSEEAGADEVEESSSGILNMIGNAMTGAQTKAAASKAAAASVSDQLDYLYATGMPAVDDAASDYYSSDSSDLEAAAAAAAAEVEAMNEMSRSMSANMDSLVGNMMTTINGGMVTGQAPVAIATPSVNISMDKAFTANMDNKQYGAQCGSGFKLPLSSTLFGSGNGTALSVEAQSTMEKSNSKTWSNNSNTVQGQTAGLGFNNASGSPLEIKDLAEPIEIWVTRSADQIDESSLVTIVNVTKPRNERMLSHVLMAPGHAALHIEAVALNHNGTMADNVTLELYIRMGRPPSIDIYDFNCTLPHPIPYRVNGTSCGELDYPDPNVCFISNTILDSYFNGSTAEVYVGVKSVGGENSSSIDEYLGSDADIETAFWPVYYRIKPFTSKCQFYDTEADDWSTDGCEVGDKSRLLQTQCFCNHLTSFGGGFEVPMNSIDLSQSAFTKLGENPVVFTFMVCMFAIYLTVQLWAYKADQRDLVKAGATPLIDNDPRDHYSYEITVFTGMRSGASTTAKVSLIITGDAEESRPRLLIDPKRRTFQRGGIDSFIMSAPRHLGNLMHVRIWHDNSGKFPSWVLSRLVIKDLETDKMYYFMCDRWLAVEEDDGQIERVIPVAGKSELTSFGFLFYSKTRRNLSDGHLWFSVFARPARSTFTRCQRTLCCLSLLFSSMMANIFFYGIDLGNATGGSFAIGPISFSLAEITIGVISSLMVFPANLIVVQMFRLSKPPPDKINWKFWKKDKKKEEEEQKTKEEIEKDKRDRMNEKAEDELVKQLEFLDTGDDSKRLLKSARSRTVRFDDEGDNRLKDENEEKAKAEENGEKKPDDGMELVAGLKKTGKKKKEKFQLPWQCFIIGWVVGYATVGVAFWLTVEVAGTFGVEKATEWLKSICFSLVQDILFSQPIKVLCLATFFALVIKKPDKEDESKSPALKGDEEFIHERMTEDELKDPEKVEQLEQQKMMCPVKPPDTDTLDEMRETRFKEIEMMSIIKEIFIYMFYLYIMFLISYGSRDQNSYGVLKSVSNTFGNAQYHGIRSLSAVGGRANFFQYLEETFIPSLYPGDKYNGQPDAVLTQQKYITDRTHVLLGKARLRQVRVYQDSCKIEDVMMAVINHCTDVYSAADDDEDSYHPGWLPVNMSDTMNIPMWETDRFDYPWKYRDWLELDSYPAYAEQFVYYGGGYAVEFGNNIDNDYEMLNYLKDMMWIDQQTRAVFLEFTVYNPTTNSHVVSLCVVEFTPTGGATPVVKFQAMTLDHYYGPFAYFVMAGEAIFVLLELFYGYREVKKIIKEKKAYFKNAWNVIELVSLGLAAGALTSYLYRLFQSNQLMGDIRADPNAFHNFQYLAMWDDLYTTMVGLLLFIATVKFIRLLRFNKNMLLLTETLSVFGYELSLFMIMFGVMYMAFSSFAFLIFYKLRDYSSFIKTLESLFGTLLGKFDFVAMLEVDRILGPLFFFFYVILIMWVMINMLLAIINESFALVKAAQAEQGNRLEIVDFMVDRFKKWTGINKKRTEPKTRKKQEYIEGIEPVQQECNDMKFKLDDMVMKLNEFIKVEKRHDKELFSKEIQDDDKPRVIYLG